MAYTSTLEAYNDMRRRSKQSLYYFAKTVCGMTDLKASFHKAYANYTSMYPWNGGPPASNRKIGIMPREHFKSSIGTVAKAIWLLLHNRSWTIGIMSVKEDHPKKWLRQIKHIIEKNPIFRTLFPEITPDYTKWDDTEILVNRPVSLAGQAQASITALSFMAGQASQHFDHLIVDDPVNEKVAKSEPLMQTARDNWDHLESLLKGWQTSSMDLTGTPWGRNDVINRAMKYDVEFGARLYWSLGARGEFKMSESLYETHPECIPNVKVGTAIFPERVDDAKLDRMEKTDPEKCYLQYYCKPYDAGRNGFDLKLVRDFAHMSDGNCKCDCHPDHDHNIRNMTLIIVSDPAVTPDKKGCESAWAVLGKAGCGCRFIFEENGGHFIASDLMKQYIMVATDWKQYVKMMGIEEVSFSTVFKSWLLEKQSNGEFPLSIKFPEKPISPGNRNKDERISGQLASVNDGLWHKRPTMRHIEGVNNLMSQLATWPYGEHRDRIDGWAYCDEVWNQAPPPGRVSGDPNNATAIRNRKRGIYERNLLAQSEE